VVGEDGLGHSLDMVVSDDGLSDDALNNGFALDWGWHWVGNSLGNMDWSWDLNDLLNRLDDIIGDIVRLGDVEVLVDNMEFLLDADDGGIHLGGSSESSGDCHLEVGNGWLEDLSGISRNIGGLAKVDFLGHGGGCLVDGGHWSTDDS
jgi:hypothetical protein